MKIGFDAKRAFSNFTGLGNYSRSTIRILTEHFPTKKYLLYTAKVPDENQVRFLDLPHHAQTHIRIPRTFIGELFPSYWRSFGILKDLQSDRIDVYHGLSHELPKNIHKTPIKTVVTIHDLIFLRYPQFYKSIDRKIYERKFRYACEHADAVIAISEQTKRDIIHFFGIDEKKISVIYQSCSPIFYQSLSNIEREMVRKKYKLPSNYLLNVGTIEERKNLMTLVKALKHSKSDLPLVVVGRKTAYFDKVRQYIHEHQLTQRIHFIEKINFSDLPAIYQMASLFIYPSFFEGFGIPIIEALHSSTPVIAAKGSCLEEAGGAHSLYIHPGDEKELAEKIDAVLSTKDLRDKMIREGKDYVKKFNEGEIAEKLIKLYKKIIHAGNH